MQCLLVPPGGNLCSHWTRSQEGGGRTGPTQTGAGAVVWGQKRVLWPFGGHEVSAPSLQTPLDATGNPCSELQLWPILRQQEPQKGGDSRPRAQGWGAAVEGRAGAQLQHGGTGLVPRGPGQQRLACMLWAFSLPGCYFAKLACSGYFGQEMQGCRLQRGKAEAVLGTHVVPSWEVRHRVPAGECGCMWPPWSSRLVWGQARLCTATPHCHLPAGGSHSAGKLIWALRSCPQNTSRSLQGQISELLGPFAATEALNTVTTTGKARCMAVLP